MTTHTARLIPRRSTALVLAGGAVLGTVAWVSAPAATAVGQADQAARQCTIELGRVSLDPPLGLSDVSQGVFHSIGAGTVDCGSQKGTAHLDGRYGIAKPASCVAGGDGWGVLTVKLGKQTLRDTFTATFGPNTEKKDAGHVDGERIDGSFVFLGTKGTCATGIAEGLIRLQATIRPAK